MKGTMIKVKEILKLNNDMTILVCDVFEDDIITKTIESNVGKHNKIEVEKISACFSKPQTRNIIVYGLEDHSNIDRIRFI